jgi:hypothetical protein
MLYRLAKYIIFLAFFASSAVFAYDGPIFDSMAQLDEKSGFAESIKRVKKAKVDKIALFARSRKFLGENEDKLIRLRDEHTSLIILGSPKYFLLRSDLSGDFIKKTINDIPKKNYLLVKFYTLMEISLMESKQPVEKGILIH